MPKEDTYLSESVGSVEKLVFAEPKESEETRSLDTSVHLAQPTVSSKSASEGYAPNSGKEIRSLPTNVAKDSNKSTEVFAEQKQSSSQPRKRRRVYRVVRVSCIRCRQAKQACDDFRPCSRCVRLGLQSSCIDAPSSRTTNCTRTSRKVSLENPKDLSYLSAIECKELSSFLLSEASQKRLMQSFASGNEIGGSSYCRNSDIECGFSFFDSDTTNDYRLDSRATEGKSLFIPVDCLTKGKPVELAFEGSETEALPFRNSLVTGRRDILLGNSTKDSSREMSEKEVSCRKKVLQFEDSNRERPRPPEDVDTNLFYSVPLSEALILSVRKVWDIMCLWDQELQSKIERAKDDLLPCAKSGALFYFVAKSIQRYVQFFSNRIDHPHYESFFTLNSAINSLTCASEEFAERLFSVLPPTPPPLSDDQQNMFLESIPIAALKMSVALDGSWHKILYVNNECCELFGTSRKMLIELLSDPSSLHLIFVDNGWVVEPLSTLNSLRKGVLKRKSNFRLKSFRNEVLDCLVSSAFGIDTNWLPKHIIFYLQSLQETNPSSERTESFRDWEDAKRQDPVTSLSSSGCVTGPRHINCVDPCLSTECPAVLDEIRDRSPTLAEKECQFLPHF
eukprot:jgi/Galph1/962/GphlegSOOS_G5710.1